MAETGEKHQSITADNGRRSGLMPPWKPGQSGNPKGRPKKRVLTTAMENLITEGMKGHDDLPKALAQKAVDMALEGNFQFFNLILERLDGKVAENIQADLHHTITLRHIKAELPCE